MHVICFTDSSRGVITPVDSKSIDQSSYFSGFDRNSVSDFAEGQRSLLSGRMSRLTTGRGRCDIPSVSLAQILTRSDLRVLGALRMTNCRISTVYGTG